MFALQDFQLDMQLRGEKPKLLVHLMVGLGPVVLRAATRALMTQAADFSSHEVDGQTIDILLPENIHVGSL